MEPGIGSYAFRWAVSHPELPEDQRMGLYEFIDAAIQMGARTVQVCDNLPVDRLSGQELREFKAYTDRKGIRIELGMKGCQPERIKKMIHLCTALDVSILRIVLGPVKGQEGSPAEYRALLANPVKEATKHGVVLAIENHFELSPFDLAGLVVGIGSPHLQVCLDAVNSVKFLAGYKETCRVLAPFAVSVHVKDVKLDRFGDMLSDAEINPLSETTKKDILDSFNTGFYISGCPLGKGVVDLNWVVREISQYGHNPCLFVESWMDPGSSVEETLAAEKHMVSHDFNQLKKLTDE